MTTNNSLLNLDDLDDPILTDNAIKVLENRYLKRDEEGKVTETPKEMFVRVAEAVASAEEENAQAYWAREFYDIMASKNFLPNSPCLMNAGRQLGMLSACFVLPIEDDLPSILDTQRSLALVQRAGGGTGFDFSRLRPNRSIVRSSGGTTAGPLSFIDAYSATTSAIQQGAFRRGANMAILRCDHPDVVDFINAKSDLSRWQNYNVSVGVTDYFMGCLKETPKSIHRVNHVKWGEGALFQSNGEVRACRIVKDADYETFEVPEGNGAWTHWTYQDTWDLICTRAWTTGEPGLFFIDHANRDNPIAHLGQIEATNPCGEQNLHAWDSCNLGSINLYALAQAEDDGVDGVYDRLLSIVPTCIRFLDNVIDINNLPIPELREMSEKTRRIGLGVMGFADMLAHFGVGYDEEEALYIAKKLQKIISDTAYLTSEKLGEEKGCFGAWKGSSYDRGATYVDGYASEKLPSIPMRNSYRTTVAPTGTISIIAGCSGGIEPLFALAFERNVMPDNDGKFVRMNELNQIFAEFLEHNKTKIPEDVMRHVIAHAITHGSIFDLKVREPEEGENFEHLFNISTKRRFLVASDLEMEEHVAMQAAWQENVDSAISKTINLNTNATIEEVSRAYLLAYESGCKGITVYRDGCRDNVEGMKQPMSVRKEKVAPPSSIVGPKLTDFSKAVKGSLRTQFGTLHVNIVMGPDGKSPIEFFAQVGKAGDLIASDLEAICRLGSLYLRNGGTLEQVIDQLQNIGSTEIMPSPDGKIVSLPDALAKVLKKYLPVLYPSSDTQAEKLVEVCDSLVTRPNLRNTGLVCPTCNSTAFHVSEGCKKCEACGYSAC